MSHTSEEINDGDLSKLEPATSIDFYSYFKFVQAEFPDQLSHTTKAQELEIYCCEHS